MNEISLYCGDCRDVLAALPDESVDTVLADPPYGIAYRSRWLPVHRRRGRVRGDERPSADWLAEAWRLTRRGGAILCFCRWDVQEFWRTAIERAGFAVKSQVIWDRVDHGMGDLRGAFAPRHDVVWFAAKGRFRFPGRRPASVIAVPRPAVRRLVHPNEKPVELLRRLAAAVTPPAGALLDPFMGSGSCGAACALEGFRYIGVEIDPGYYALACRRIRETILRKGA